MVILITWTGYLLILLSQIYSDVRNITQFETVPQEITIRNEEDLTKVRLGQKVRIGHGQGDL